ncbi:MAG: hypothetical protein H0V32_01635 [Nocardioidaceae bacterium]|nr:hypothetical protein [Nocardioidaceae bacterium]
MADLVRKAQIKPVRATVRPGAPEIRTLAGERAPERHVSGGAVAPSSSQSGGRTAAGIPPRSRNRSRRRSGAGSRNSRAA